MPMTTPTRSFGTLAPIQAAHHAPPRWRNRSPETRPASRAAGPSFSDSGARRNGRCRREPPPCSGSRSDVTPERPASRLWRNSARLLPFGAASPIPVMTMRFRSDNDSSMRSGKVSEIEPAEGAESHRAGRIVEGIAVPARPASGWLDIGRQAARSHFATSNAFSQGTRDSSNEPPSTPRDELGTEEQ